jgi:hypothetical protein
MKTGILPPGINVDSVPPIDPSSLIVISQENISEESEKSEEEDE